MIYKLLSKEIQKIINQEDPFGLIIFGAPMDEYDSEIAKIIKALKSVTTIIDINYA